MFPKLLDLFFPRTSLTGREGEWITPEELRSLPSSPVILERPHLRREGLAYVDRIIGAADYHCVPLLHCAVHTFKYRRVRGVGERLGGLLSEASSLVGPFSMPSPRPSPVATGEGARRVGEGRSVLCPVPLHWTRQFRRGFNQAQILAQCVADARGWQVLPLLRRIRPTGSQVGRRRRDRLLGVRDAFGMRSGLGIPERVILIDDLSTTGATLDMCAKALKAGGVRNVVGLVLAIG